MEKILWIRDRFTKCDSGILLNPLMHIFLFMTATFSVAFLFFENHPSVQQVVLYQQTKAVGDQYVNIWGSIGLLVIIIHTIAFLIRGRLGVILMQFCVFGGVYLWLWASIIYWRDDYYFQFLVNALPNMVFWAWYYKQWTRRIKGEKTAFV